MEWTGLIFEPYLPWSVLWVALFITSVLLIGSYLKSPRGSLLRAFFFLSLFFILANPILLKEDKQLLNDQVVVLVDKTESQNVGERQAQNEAALNDLLEAYESEPDIDVHIVEVTPPKSTDGTKILPLLREGIASVPQAQLAGVFIISDGIIHENINVNLLPSISAPIHSLITGDKNFKDRRIDLIEAPVFAIVNRPVDLVLKVEDFGVSDLGSARIKAHRDGELIFDGPITVGSPRPLSIEPIKRGEMIIDIEVVPLPGETSLQNNHIIHKVNAIQDRLRVLLVSGEPHTGERVWRTTLKSDPAVDLIHFTILRLPTSLDSTPVDEMALIPFPTEELFQNSLEGFDLVIFDRYTLRGVLQMQYLENLTYYVEDGGAILVSAGPEFAAPFSLSSTPLGRILPLQPSGEILEEGFVPAITDLGKRHPITQDLKASSEDDWGRWFRLVNTQKIKGDTLLDGPGGAPLLTLSRYGKGRVAILTSDQIWMWAKGIDGGGPHRELLRRIIHWLMQEPDLEEKRLEATSTNQIIKIEKRDLREENGVVNISGPNDFEDQITLTYQSAGISIGEISVSERGLYQISADGLTTLVAVGSSNRLEFSNLQPTDTHFAPLAEETGGSVTWLSDGIPRFRRVSGVSNTDGRGWVAITSRGASQTLSLEQSPLIPPYLGLLILLITILGAWWRESR